MVKFAELVENSAAVMRLDLARSRLATKHPGLKGAGAEEILAKFLVARLPTSLGVTTGHVVDAKGNLSKQVDVIIYDALRTPVLFESALNGWDVVPAEGVLAVIEVKMHLTASHLTGVVENCQSVLGLSRDAYIGSPVPTVAAYGKTWSELPIYYSVFAFEADNMYASELNGLLKDLPLHQRVGSVCYLDQGVNLHGDLSSGKAALSAMPTPLATLFDVATSSALLVWFTGLSTVVFQAAGRPINLLQYAPDEHQLVGTLPGQGPEAGKALATKGGGQVLQAMGLDPAIAGKVMNKEPLSADEVTSIVAIGGSVETLPDGGQKVNLPLL